jgi:ribonuclease D
LKTEVTDPGKNEELTSLLKGLDRVAIDTEFMREKTFYAQLCLIQLATPTTIYCADPLTGSDLDRFWTALNSCAWVLHSGRQDVEVFYQTAGQMPANVFDTQIAAGLLGYAPQMGYATLVKELFGKELAKSHTRADWTRRPLPAEMIEYAAEDVEFLLGACDELSARLKALGRLDWAHEDSARLLNPALYEDSPSASFDRLKGARSLTGRARSAAACLAVWREQRAAHSNRPRQWILKDAVLLDLAVSNPDDAGAIAAIPGMPSATARRSASELLTVLGNASDSDDGYVPPTRPDEKQKALLKIMQAEVAKKSADLGIAAEIIAPKKELSNAMLGDRESRVFSGWRHDVVGQRLLEVMV